MAAASLYRAIAKSMMSRYAVYAANAGSMMLLARLFSPAEFGLVASISVLTVFFQLVVEGGMSPAIIGAESMTARERDGLFTAIVLVSGAIGAAFFLASPLVAAFYRSPAVADVVPYSAAALACYGFAVLPLASLLRDQHFRSISAAGVAAEIVSTCGAVALLHWASPVTALATKAMVSASVYFLLLYAFSSATEIGRPRMGSDVLALRKIIGFSAYQFGFNFVNYFSRNLDNILVGRQMGATSLGVYDKAYQLMRYPLLLLTFAMTPAIQPVIRKHADEPRVAANIHSDFALRLSLVAGVVSVLMFLLAEKLVLALFGGQWGAAVPVVKVLAIAVPVQVLMSTSGGFFQALNRPDVMFASGVVSALVTCGAIAIAMFFGDLVAIAWAIVIAFHVNFVVTYVLLHRAVFKVGSRRFFLETSPAVLASAGMGVAFFLS